MDIEITIVIDDGYHTYVVHRLRLSPPGHDQMGRNKPLRIRVHTSMIFRDGMG